MNPNESVRDHITLERKWKLSDFFFFALERKLSDLTLVRREVTEYNTAAQCIPRQAASIVSE